MRCSIFSGVSTTVRASLWTVACITGLLAVLTACETAAERKAKENAEINKQAAAELTRICALHGQDREAELKKLKQASGMELVCPND